MCAGAGLVGATIAGGPSSGRQVFVSTDDGGHRWTVVPLSLPGRLFLWNCSSRSVCAGVATSPNYSQVFARSTDGGATWTVRRPFPAGSEVEAISCPTADECVATGSYFGNGSSLPQDFAMSTADGGVRWEQGRLSGGPVSGLLTSLSCATALDCTAISMFNGVGVPSSLPALRAGAHAGSNSCPPTGCPVLVPNLVTTHDGGQDWTAVPFDDQGLISGGPGYGPASLKALCAFFGDRHLLTAKSCGPAIGLVWSASYARMIASQLSITLDCPAPGSCWLGGPWGLSSTNDGGRSWAVERLHDNAYLPLPDVPVFSLSCPAVAQCVVVGLPAAFTPLSAGAPVFTTTRSKNV